MRQATLKEYIERLPPTADARIEYEAMLQCIKNLRNCLGDWVEIQDDEDAREDDAFALDLADSILNRSRQ